MPKVKLFVPIKKRSKETQKMIDTNLVFRVLDKVGLLEADPTSLVNPLGGVASVAAKTTNKLLVSIVKRLVKAGANAQTAFEVTERALLKDIPRAETFKDLLEAFSRVQNTVPIEKRSAHLLKGTREPLEDVLDMMIGFGKKHLDPANINVDFGTAFIKSPELQSISRRSDAVERIVEQAQKITQRAEAKTRVESFLENLGFGSN